MPEISAPIVGMRFRPPALTILQGLGNGEPLELRREPHNEYDENAIAVWLPKGWEANNPEVAEEAAAEAESLGKELGDAGVMLGYIPREIAKVWAPVFDAALLANNSLPPAVLSFSASGSPQVTLTIQGDDEQDSKDPAEETVIEADWQDEEEDEDELTVGDQIAYSQFSHSEGDR